MCRHQHRTGPGSSRRNSGVYAGPSEHGPRLFSVLATDSSSTPENIGVQPGWLPEAADLTDILQGRRSDLVLGRRHFGISKGLDASTHGTKLARAPATGQKVLPPMTPPCGVKGTNTSPDVMVPSGRPRLSRERRAGYGQPPGMENNRSTRNQLHPSPERE